MNLAIAGCLGRMGRMLVEHLSKESNILLVGGTVEPGQAAAAKKYLASLDLPDFVISEDPAKVLAKADAIIDFAAPAHSLAIAKIAAEQGKVHVCGTTGFAPEQLKQLKEYGKKARIVQSYNMSAGVNLLFALTEKVAAALDEEYDIEILEMHHRLKKDAPSGTAFSLGDAAARGRNTTLEKTAVRGRDGITGERKTGSIGFAALRGGDVVGDHTVIFAGDGERIELTHKASSREIYASGALRAALWAKDQPPGFYTMRDVLEIK